MGAQDDFEQAQDFLNDTDNDELTMLWESTGSVWRINRIMANSSIQLFSHDLSQGSGILFFNDDDRDLILEAAPQQPWAP